MRDLRLKMEMIAYLVEEQGVEEKFILEELNSRHTFEGVVDQMFFDAVLRFVEREYGLE